jgi:hypothetical protein
MKRNYLTITAIVTVLGVAFIFLPQTYTINLAPEQVTLWEDTSNGAIYIFNTGTQSVDDGVSPYIEVWSNDMVTLNTTFLITGMGETIPWNTIDNPAEFLLPGPGEWTIEITGNVVEEETTEINAGFYYLRPLEPETIIYYPYRYFGYGMTLIGVISTLVVYLRTRQG